MVGHLSINIMSKAENVKLEQLIHDKSFGFERWRDIAVVSRLMSVKNYTETCMNSRITTERETLDQRHSGHV
jgi:hypothetical protein